ncbi:hypothetical protein [Candidiatus Paracoxiella cheracis]|uniref:hypothetical protein n=1 Tax=Candidiatus Paracoxiella cheracis TaxID=3405120 RepID=UPI003BF51A6B
MKLMKEMMELLRKRGDKISFNKEVLLDLLKNYPSNTINILRDDAKDALSDDSLKLIIEQVTATERTPSQVIHALCVELST